MVIRISVRIERICILCIEKKALEITDVFFYTSSCDTKDSLQITNRISEEYKRKRLIWYRILVKGARQSWSGTLRFKTIPKNPESIDLQ